MFTNGDIADVVVRDLKVHSDPRGWLIEIFREDEIDPRYRPVMEYISMTEPGVARGPHEHADQADFFAFIGPSTFRIYLWDNRKGSPTYRHRTLLLAGEGLPRTVVIPPGVVHAYKNIGEKAGMVVNLPNRLFAGPGRKEKVDETRHENDPHSIFVID
jgi:dTDP-4-dehydrorhamnose 3,5-epimerase